MISLTRGANSEYPEIRSPIAKTPTMALFRFEGSIAPKSAPVITRQITKVTKGFVGSSFICYPILVPILHWHLIIIS